jgi:hypothetical protein
MGRTDRIYGSIFRRVGGASHPDYVRRVSETLWALEMLPLQDCYPPLTRNMFSLTSSRYRIPGLYKELVIHFGLTVKNIEEQWDVWLGKFESVLEILNWEHARTHLEFESAPDGFQEECFDYRWTFPDGAEKTDRRSWKFEGGPREFGRQIKRIREHASAMKERLEVHPDDVEILRSLIPDLGRLGDYDETLQYWAHLESLNRQVAESVPYDQLVSWGERCLGKE